MPYVPPIPKAHLETYRAAARAYRATRRKNARQHEWHWAAVREVINAIPKVVLELIPLWGEEIPPSKLGYDFLNLFAEGFSVFNRRSLALPRHCHRTNSEWWWGNTIMLLS
jgi:hypothetical protein